ncbi:MAG: carboxypeptidase-like regulatory domain-containing protein, partial [Solirubrobacteraceae bacterium]
MSDLLAGPIRATGAEQPRPVIVRLARGGSHIVTVVDDAGRPILDANVHVRGHWWTMIRTTDAAGKATLRPLPPGWVSIAVDAPGHAPARRNLDAAPVAQPGEMTIVLPSISEPGRGVSVSGRVVDERRAPIAEARIAVIEPYRGALPLAPILTNDRGEFTAPALVRGAYELQAIDDEHAPSRSTPVKVADVPIEGIEITMKDGGVISGVVLDGDRKPAPFATLIALQGGAPMREVITDAGGAFELRGMPRASFWLRAEGTTATSRVLGVSLSGSAQAEAEVELVLDSIGTITGTVVDERGAPLAGITVAASLDWKRPMPTRVGPLTLLDAVTDIDGAFVLRGPPAMPYLLEARRRRFVNAGPSPQSTPAMTGDHDVRIRLVPEGRITGRIVVAGLDTPPTDVNIHLWPAPPALVRRDGSFEIAEVPPGTYDASFGSPDFFPFGKTGIEV